MKKMKILLHDLRQKIRARYDLQKYYFTNRVVNMWNSLSSYVVSAESVNCFKNRPDNFWKNLANKFSQCTFSIAEHYDLFSGLIILRQAWWRRSYDVIPHRPHQTGRETAAGKAQCYHTDLKLIYMLPITPYTSRQFRVDGHLKSVRNNRRVYGHFGPRTLRTQDSSALWYLWYRNVLLFSAGAEVSQICKL